MSHSDQSPHQATREPLGSRENFFAYSDDEYQSDDADRGHREYPGVTKERWMAKTILASHPAAAVLCPQCFSMLDTAAELSEPADYVAPSQVVVDDRFTESPYPTSTDSDRSPSLDLTDLGAGGWSLLQELITEERYGDHRRHRHCPTCGLVAFGGMLRDLPTDAFEDVVEDVLTAVDSVPPRRRRQLHTDAMSRKSEGLSDTANIELLARHLTLGTDASATKS